MNDGERGRERERLRPPFRKLSCMHFSISTVLLLSPVLSIFGTGREGKRKERLYKYLTKRRRECPTHTHTHPKKQLGVHVGPLFGSSVYYLFICSY